MRWRVTPAGAGALVIAALMLAAGLMKTINLLILLGDLLIVLVIANAVIAWRTIRSLRLETGSGSEAHAGEMLPRLLTIANDSSRMCSAVVREKSTQHDATAFATAIPPKSSTSVRLQVRFAERGEFLSTVSLLSGYPFGFVTCERPDAARENIAVLPSLGTLDGDRFRRWLLRSSGGEARTRRAIARQSPHQADLRGVRAFRSGDSPRLIHWRSSARRNELLVREFESPESRDLVLVLEPWLPKRPRGADLDALEVTISLAATLLYAWCHGDESPRVTLVLPDQETIEGRASPGHARKLLRALAAVRGAEEFALKSLSPSVRSSRAVRLLVSSRPTDGPLMAQLREVGSWQRLAPQAPSWYHPPKSTTKITHAP